MDKTDKASSNPSANTLYSAENKSHPFWRIFWLSFLVASLAYAWYSFYVPSNDVAWVDTMASAQDLANESEKNMLLFFTGDRCVPCRIMKREVFADKEVAKAINSKIIPIMINIDDPEMKDIVTQYNIGGTPITLFTDPQGNVLDYAVGKIGKTKFIELVEKIDEADF